MAWLRLIRWPNLVIVALTQFAAWWCIVWPHRQQALVLVPGNFLLLCLSTVLIAAGGYIINDYFDIRIDLINKPDKVILERLIPRKYAIIVHSVMSLVALMLAAAVAIPPGHPEWLLLQAGCILLLWRYSTTWKRAFVTGNVAVAMMTALTVIALIIYEPVMQHYLQIRSAEESGLHVHVSFPNAAIMLGIFAAFAFLLTWMREIVKDMEDYRGDDAEGCVTMPIRWGLLRSSRFVQALGVTSILMLLSACLALWRWSSGFSVSAFYIVLTLAAPLVFWVMRLPTAATAAHYHRSSTQLKWIMVSGVVSLLVLKMMNYA